MSVKHVTINGSQKVWMARIAYRGVRKSRVCRTKEEARQAERELSAACRQEAERAEREGASPATVKHLCEYYVLDLERRGKGPATIGRAVTTAKAIEAVAPALLAMPVSRVTARDVYDFRQARLVAGSKPSTINRDLRSLRAMLKQARPDFRFPGSAFLPEDETRVRWLRPEEDPRAADDALALPRDGHAGRAHAHAPGRNHRAASRARAPRTGRDHAPTCQGGRPAGDPKRGGTEDPPRPARGPRERLGVPRAIRRAVPPGLRRPHDLRHHGATTALNRGFTAPIVMALGGWKTERMMRRYAAVTDQTLRAAAEAVSGNEPWQWSAKSPSIQPSSPPLQAEVAGSSPAPPTIVSVTRVSVTRAPESRRPLLHGAAGQSGRVNPTTASRPGRESPRLPG
jgi:integrase